MHTPNEYLDTKRDPIADMNSDILNVAFVKWSSTSTVV